MLAWLAVFRTVWLLVGPRWTRLSGLALHPRQLFAYLVSVTSRNARSYAGHNPAASWTLLGMLAIALCLTVTGLATAQGYEGLEELHALLGHALLVLAGLHIAGVLLHTLVHRDGLVLSILDGRKATTQADGIPSARGFVAILLLASVGGLAAVLASGSVSLQGRVRLPSLGSGLSQPEGNESYHEETEAED